MSARKIQTVTGVRGREDLLDYGAGSDAIVQRTSTGLNPITASDLTGVDGSGLTGLSGGSVDNTLHFTAAQAVHATATIPMFGQTGTTESVTNAGGTTTGITDSSGIYNSATTAGTTGAFARTGACAIGTMTGLANIYHVVKTPTTLAAMRVWYGSCSSAGFLSMDTNDSPAALSFDFIGFRFSTNASDTKWKLVTNCVANSTQLVQDSGVTVTLSTRYILRVKVLSATSVEFYINGTLVGSASGLSIPTLALFAGFSCATLENVAKTFFFSKNVAEYSV